MGSIWPDGSSHVLEGSSDGAYVPGAYGPRSLALRQAVAELVEQYNHYVLRAVLWALASHPRLGRDFDPSDFTNHVWAEFLTRMQEQPVIFRDSKHLATFLAGMAKNSVYRQQQRLDTQKQGGGRQLSLGGAERQRPDRNRGRATSGDRLAHLPRGVELRLGKASRVPSGDVPPAIRWPQLRGNRRNHWTK